MKSRCDFEALEIETRCYPHASLLLPNLRQDSLHFRSREHRFTREIALAIAKLAPGREGPRPDATGMPPCTGCDQ